MRKDSNRPVLLMLVFAATFITGCATGTSAPSQFYLLSPMPEAESAKDDADLRNTLAIGVGPVTLPQYLDRPQIVTRESSNRLELGEFDRWAEPLKHNVTRVLAENLSVLLSTTRVAIHPWPRNTLLDYQIVVHVIRLDSKADGTVILKAHWSILKEEGGEVLRTRLVRLTESADSSDYEALAAAKSRALGELSRRIASALESVSH